MPFPPSVNQIYRNVPKVGRVKTGEYKAWCTKADKYALLTPRPQYTKPVRAEYVFHKPDNRRRDLSNLEKAVGDTLVRWKVLTDDCLIHHLTLRWAAPGEVLHGEVCVTIEEI